jgi:hypothetical protein
MYEKFFAHWQVHGEKAIELLYKESPKDYVKIGFATFYPKEFVVESTIAGLDEDERDRMIEVLRRHLLAAPDKPFLIEDRLMIEGKVEQAELVDAKDHSAE